MDGLVNLNINIVIKKPNKRLWDTLLQKIQEKRMDLICTFAQLWILNVENCGGLVDNEIIASLDH